MLPARIDPAMAISMAATGSIISIDEAPEGLFDEMVDSPAELHDAAVRWLGGQPANPTRRTPRCIDETNRAAVGEGLSAIRESLHDKPAVHAVIEAVEVGLTDGFTAALAAERRLLVSLRHTDIARNKLQAFFARNA
jgi:enoyl-CoA hydratase/carnithine racemase